VVRDVGGWDTRYVGGGEDIAFSWRAQELGYSVGCAPDAIVHHRRRATLATLARQSFRRGRQVPRLMNDFRGSPLGSPRLRRGAVKTALRLIASAPRAAVQAGARGTWVRIAATALGVVVGRLERRLRDRRRSSPA
jgi:GT2 family glycosyltransferase